ncbi:MAG: trigger factor [Spirochaetaceae bacterium]|nr:MAG: trigger factor [Spirochaetaceae bacterium]
MQRRVTVVISQKEVSVKENSRVYLKMTVPGNEIQREYDEVIREYCEKVHMKGFRKGKVPKDVLVRKFSEELKGETTYTVIKKSLDEAFESIEEKPLAYSMPELTDSKVVAVPGQDFTFEVFYDTYPKIELAPYTGVHAEKPGYTIGDEDIAKELLAIQERNSIVKEKADGKVEKKNIVTVDYVELDNAGNPVTGSAREGFVFEVGSGLSLYKFDDDILDMKQGEEKILKKAFPADFEYPELAGREVSVRVKAVIIKEKILPALDDELAQDVSDKFKTLDDLKKDIKERLVKVAEDKIKEILATRIITEIAEKSTIPVPETMVTLELEQSWKDFCARLNNREDIVLQALEQEKKTKESLLAEWKPNVEKKIRSELVLNEIEEKEKLEAVDADVEQEIRKFALERGLEFDKAKEQYEKANMLAYLKRSITREKTFDFLIENADLKAGKKLKLLDLIAGNY